MSYNEEFPPLERDASAPTPPPSETSRSQADPPTGRVNTPPETPETVATAEEAALDTETATPGAEEPTPPKMPETAEEAAPDDEGAAPDDEEAAPIGGWSPEYGYPYQYSTNGPGHYGAMHHQPWDMSGMMTMFGAVHTECLSTISQLTGMLAAAQLGKTPPAEAQQQLAEAQQQLVETRRQLAETRQQLYEVQEQFQTFMQRPPLPECARLACLGAREHCEHCAAFKSVVLSPEGVYTAAICGDCIERIQRNSKCGAPGCEKRPYVNPLGEASPYCAECYSAVEQQVMATKAIEEVLKKAGDALERQRAAARNAVPDVRAAANRQVKALDTLNNHIKDVCNGAGDVRKLTLRRKNVADAKAAAKAARARQNGAGVI